MRDFILLLFFVNVMQSMAILTLPIVQPSALNLNLQPNNGLFDKLPSVRGFNVIRGKPLQLKKNNAAKVSMSLSMPFGFGGHFSDRSEPISINPIVPGSINPSNVDPIIGGGDNNNNGDLFERPVEFFGSSDDQFGVLNQNESNSNQTNSKKKNSSIAETMELVFTALEIANDIEIIYAAECGESQWSIEYADSIPNICFAFIQNDKRPYKSLNSAHISTSTDEIKFTVFDITGLVDQAWQLQPNAMEFLLANTTYRSDDKRYSVAQKLRGLLLQKPRVSKLVKHYWSNSRKEFMHIFSDEKGSVGIEEYLTIVRNVAIIDWLNRTHVSTWPKNARQPKPVEKLVELNFNALLRDLKGHMSSDLHNALVDLVKLAKESKKKDRVAQIQVVNDYIFEKLRNGNNILQQAQQNEAKMSDFSNDFMKVLDGIFITKFGKVPY